MANTDTGASMSARFGIRIHVSPFSEVPRRCGRQRPREGLREGRPVSTKPALELQRLTQTTQFGERLVELGAVLGLVQPAADAGGVRQRHENAAVAVKDAPN